MRGLIWGQYIDWPGTARGLVDDTTASGKVPELRVVDCLFSPRGLLSLATSFRETNGIEDGRRGLARSHFVAVTGMGEQTDVFSDRHISRAAATPYPLAEEPT